MLTFLLSTSEAEVSRRRRRGRARSGRRCGRRATSRSAWRTTRRSTRTGDVGPPTAGPRIQTVNAPSSASRDDRRPRSRRLRKRSPRRSAAPATARPRATAFGIRFAAACADPRRSLSATWPLRRRAARRRAPLGRRRGSDAASTSADAEVDGQALVRCEHLDTELLATSLGRLRHVLDHARRRGTGRGGTARAASPRHSVATQTAYSTVQWPHVVFCSNSAAVYCASWISRSTPSAQARRTDRRPHAPIVGLLVVADVGDARVVELDPVAAHRAVVRDVAGVHAVSRRPRTAARRVVNDDLAGDLVGGTMGNSGGPDRVQQHLAERVGHRLAPGRERRARRRGAATA